MGYIARREVLLESRIRLQTSNATTRGVLYSNRLESSWLFKSPTTGVCQIHPRLAILCLIKRLWRHYCKNLACGNDGSGTGLDADTVDGIQAASFLRSDTNDSVGTDVRQTFQIVLGLQLYGLEEMAILPAKVTQ